MEYSELLDRLPAIADPHERMVALFNFCVLNTVRALTEAVGSVSGGHSACKTSASNPFTDKC